MVSAKFFHLLSSVLGQAKLGQPGVAFGGLNVIICGDFHQFPPVAGRPLYWPSDPEGDEDEKIGRGIWREFLGRLRHGGCNARDAEMVESLTLSSTDSAGSGMRDERWNDAVLVTPRHAVRRRWNEAGGSGMCRRPWRTRWSLQSA